jgi:hypothetical protein
MRDDFALIRRTLDLKPASPQSEHEAASEQMALFG